MIYDLTQLDTNWINNLSYAELMNLSRQIQVALIDKRDELIRKKLHGSLEQTAKNLFACISKMNTNNTRKNRTVNSISQEDFHQLEQILRKGEYQKFINEVTALDCKNRKRPHNKPISAEEHLENRKVLLYNAISENPSWITTSELKQCNKPAINQLDDNLIFSKIDLFNEYGITHHDLNEWCSLNKTEDDFDKLRRNHQEHWNIIFKILSTKNDPPKGLRLSQLLNEETENITNIPKGICIDIE